MSAADGLPPVGEAIALGLLAVTAWQIAINWDELWRDAEKILVQQEPEPQIYTTPTDPEVETQRTTGHAPPEVETGTRGTDLDLETKTPTHTGHGETDNGDLTPQYFEATSDEARKKVMQLQGITTSQKPFAQSRNESGLEYRYRVSKSGGGIEIKSVQQQTLDRSHLEKPHWEAGTVKIDDSGNVIMNQYGRPKIKNNKSKVYYND